MRAPSVCVCRPLTSRALAPQLEEGRRLGLKTIFMSHHQWFSRTESLGTANDRISEALTEPDRLVRA
jgi:hypothetical protein